MYALLRQIGAVVLTVAATGMATGCSTTYLATTGRLVTVPKAQALMESAAHDLKCAPSEIKDVSEGLALIFEGCGFRISYEIKDYGDSQIIVMASRVPAS